MEMKIWHICHDAGQTSHSNVDQSTCWQEQATEVGASYLTAGGNQPYRKSIIHKVIRQSTKIIIYQFVVFI